jgi:hypothetical protein
VPDPLAVIHVWFVVADQTHPLEVPTVNVPLPPADVSVRLVGVSVYEHVFAACVTVKVRPAIVNVPVRCKAVEFGATVKFTAPLPVPLLPPVTVIHAKLLVATHEQLEVVVTVDDPFAPPATTDCVVGEIENVQPA